MLSQKLLDLQADAGAHAFAQVPIDRGALTHAFDQVSRDGPQLRVPEYFDGALLCARAS